MRTLPLRPRARIGLGIVAVALLAVVAAGGWYVFGGGGAPAAHGAITAAPLVAGKGETAFTIDSSASQATFTMHEVLFGQPNTVVGKTSQVAGEILVNTRNPAQSRLGQIRVDLSTLVTDSDLRNRTIQSRILETSQPANQYATFTETSIKGLPATVAAGQTVAFQVVGNLTIHGVTRSETFSVSLTPQSATRLSGQAQATVRYADFSVAVPNVPSVTGLSDTVTLALSFVATAA
ncbi:MAG: YceI family protein [Ktedonobacterales bacterium]